MNSENENNGIADHRKNDSSMEAIVTQVKKWLGEDGINLFRKYKEEHGTVSPVFMEGGIPHPVHTREGMQVRNILRSIPECETWTCYELDNTWAHIVKAAIA